ncbi:hypothetical protein DFA_10004 [Cavenderia fasciculata]|uniref:J domain-containing protein n=1 Tax=Cavenderia fasciculata TaxID=261658 RepID=F4Q909_CACFS|nr:uncharacterized protein DFA_10004 [Cavenderia fasciculata]EGG15178.1 hypothetical protein DFA_10004 [Cavenderia fasciculata]|eukprot:XP_004351898.1 hypothetical protein DFA_10004 [Cavenderia fasciculata]
MSLTTTTIIRIKIFVVVKVVVVVVVVLIRVNINILIKTFGKAAAVLLFCQSNCLSLKLLLSILPICLSLSLYLYLSMSLMSDQQQQPIRPLIEDNDERSFYEILGVNEKASEGDLKRAYYRLAKEVHPDKNNSQEAKDQFQKLGRIYNILKDPQTRSFYDENGDVEQTEMGLSGEDIYELWLKQYNIVRLTEEKISQYFQSIENEKKKYGLTVSSEEEQDLLDFYHKKKGDMKLIKEYVFNCETKKDIIRMCDHLNKMIKDEKLQSYPLFYKTASLSPDDNSTSTTSTASSTSTKKVTTKKKKIQQPVEQDVEDQEEEEEDYDDLDMIDDEEEEEEEEDSGDDEKPKKKKKSKSTKVPKTKKPLKNNGKSTSSKTKKPITTTKKKSNK